MGKTYNVKRLFRDRDFKWLMKSGLTLEEAQAHCQDPETSSSTCTTAIGNEITEACGAWFDGYDEDGPKQQTRGFALLPHGVSFWGNGNTYDMRTAGEDEMRAVMRRLTNATR